MITIQPYDPKYFDELTSYELDEQQATFALVPKNMLTNPEIMENTMRTQYCILSHDTPVGLFSLDLSDDRLIYTENKDSILLRALSIMPNQQGKGIAKATMLLLPDLVREYYPTVNKIVFGVSYENTLAYNLYLKTGYDDSGRTYQGIKGPQHCMTKSL
ncbi:GNAT family N-acetyltransferase [Myroides profundi]|uniref:Acetyltransferase (GNAT) family protein n=1 Tax=Myroides profundi TaxID=480520 RepID=A0AAJ5BF59_MYRPR|nr:GNAT family N-acetyltransferase [Myroides profundi]AJH15045.1 GNAT family acetyltransferase [Myroides profundi]SER45955.1 Acetyltransferase (GNAT) family protein [Myroides profundi]